ncbi:Sialic acid transporter NanT [Sodalis praecaptivus]
MNNSSPHYAATYPGANPAMSSRRTFKIMMSAGIGHFIEWFDFGLYGTLAVIIGANFFACGDPAVALLKSFAVFGSGFLMRPLGGLFFGSMGDRLGRRKVLVTVIMITSISTFIMGLLPTCHQVGILAPVLLVLTRLLQGFVAGAKVPASLPIWRKAPHRTAGPRLPAGVKTSVLWPLSSAPGWCCCSRTCWAKRR